MLAKNLFFFEWYKNVTGWVKMIGEWFASADKEKNLPSGQNRLNEENDEASIFMHFKIPK